MAIDDRRRATRRGLQVAAWRGSDEVALLSPAPDHPAPSAELIAAELDRLATRGVRRVLTGALHQRELDPFLTNGFTEHERLHLLRHELGDLPAAEGPVRTRRARPRDLHGVLDIDVRAFDEFWALDERGLADAIRATPSSRYRVMGDRKGQIQAYAVSGRAADRGYLQRLAVNPDHQRAGLGRTLVTDALTWLRRTGARAAMVNTQQRNQGALALYLACGFVEEPSGLSVLVLDLAHPGPGPR